MHASIYKRPRGALVTRSPNGLNSDHIPFELLEIKAENRLLTANVARTNPVWQQCNDGGRCAGDLSRQ
jgi:transcriptional regulator